MHSSLFDITQTQMQRICHAFDAIGLVWHHSSSASLVICMLVTGAARPEQSVLHPILLLCAQHSFVLLRYWYRTAYIVIVLGLEIFFQWLLFSNLERLIWICTGTISTLMAKSRVGRNEEEDGISSEESAV